MLFSLLSLMEYFCESQVALVYPNNDPVMFMVAFYGCLLAEVIPVPIEVPLTRKVIMIDHRGDISYKSKLETNKLLVLDALNILEVSTSCSFANFAGLQRDVQVVLHFTAIIQTKITKPWYLFSVCSLCVPIQCEIGEKSHGSILIRIKHFVKKKQWEHCCLFCIPLSFIAVSHIMEGQIPCSLKTSDIVF